MNKCIGCGINLQNSSPNELGYTKKIDNLYCERCFKTIHYNEEKKISDFDNKLVINKINKINCMTIFITDLLSINKDLIDIYNSIKNKKVLVINKCDIIPNNLKLEHLKDNIKDSYKIDSDIFFISAKKDLYLSRVIKIIEENKTVLLCGETSSGKSTLINKLINSKLTTSKYNNTTLDFIKLKYQGFIIYDTPGLIINNNKEYSEKIKIKVKPLKKDYVYTFDDIKINGNVNLTIIQNEHLNILSKKEDYLLEKIVNIPKNSDIVLTNGFIYIKDETKINSNKELEIRKSIIGR